MFSGCEMEIVNLGDQKQFREVQDFLAQFDLTFDREVEYTLRFRLDGKIVGTGSFAGNVLRNIALEKSLQGNGLVAEIVTALMQEQGRRGRFHYFIFTRTCTVNAFQKLGFTEIARAEPYVSLLEMGMGSVSAYCRQIERRAAQLEGERAAVILKGDPSSEKNRTCIQLVAEEEEAVLVFVDPSYSVGEQIADLGNVCLVPANPYRITPEIYPTYFLPPKDHVVSRVLLDADLFANQIASRLKITSCYVSGKEDRIMLDTLPSYGIPLHVLRENRPDHAIEGIVV